MVLAPALRPPSHNDHQRAAGIHGTDDLERFLDHKAIRARRISRASRLWRWARRNPALAALIAVLVFLSIAGPLSAIRQHQLAEAVRQEN